MADIRFRSRRVCLSMQDWMAFSGILAREWPEARYYPFYLRDAYTEGQPDMQLAESLADLLATGENRVPKIVMTIDREWVPELRRSPSGEWQVVGPAFLRADIRPGGDVHLDRHGYPPHISHGEIDVRCQPGAREHFAFARRFYRLFKDIATNTNQIGYTYPAYDVLWTIEKGSDTWLGHDAIRWAREDKRRLLYYEDRGETGWGYRPNDEGIVKPAK